MEVITLSLGLGQTNCYIIHKDSKCVVIDPGDWWEEIEKVLIFNELKLLAILITHRHYDHIGAVDEGAKSHQVPVYAHEFEADGMKDPSKNLSVLMGLNTTAVADRFIAEGETLVIGCFEFDVIEVSGHTEHSLCFYSKELGAVFTGDTLFKSSVGRVDFHNGTMEELCENIKHKLLVLPTDTLVYPGHGPFTSIEIEAKANPYIR